MDINGLVEKFYEEENNNLLTCLKKYLDYVEIL